MKIYRYFIAFETILYKEVYRFCRVWVQALMPGMITAILYFLIFGHLMGARLGAMDGISYSKYIAPGLIMMALINNTYMNTAVSFYISRFTRDIEELLIAPVPNYVILWGHVAGAMTRGIIIGVLVTIVSLSFTHLSLLHPLVMIAIVILASMLFALAGFLNSLFATSFDSAAFVPTFILTPLSYLGGIFYSVKMLPSFWQQVSLFNPILYIINGFRYALLGIKGINLAHVFIVLILFVSVLYLACIVLLRRGIGIKN